MAGLTLPVVRVPCARGHHALAILLLVVALLGGASTARAQAPKAFKIGILTSAWSPWHSNTEGFREALKALLMGHTPVATPTVAAPGLSPHGQMRAIEIGRASCRERVFRTV